MKHNGLAMKCSGIGTLNYRMRTNFIRITNLTASTKSAIFDPKKRIIFTRYRESITEQDVWKLFVSAFNTILKQLQNE